MYYLKFDNCKYLTVFETGKRSIELQLSHDNLFGCYVVLSFYDVINQQAVLSSVIDDL